MNARIIGGWALLGNALLSLVLLLEAATGSDGSALSLVIGEVLSLLFILGLFAIWAAQPHHGQVGRIGQLGLWCLGVATGIAFLVRLAVLVGAVDVADILPFSSAVLGLLGSILLGWATIRARVFHPLIGWLLILGGALNLIGGLLPSSAVATAVGVVATLAQAGAIGGYGWTMLRGAMIAQPASAD